MLTRRSNLSTGIAALLGLGILVTPMLAGAQSYRYRHNTSAENSSRTGALILGAAGLLLSANHQSTLGTIALGGAAYETYQMQQQINKRHQRYGNYDGNGGYQNYGSYDQNGGYQNNGYSNRDNSYPSGDSGDSGYGYTSAPSNGYYDSYGRWQTSGTTYEARHQRSRSCNSRDTRNGSDRERNDE